MEIREIKIFTAKFFLHTEITTICHPREGGDPSFFKNGKFSTSELLGIPVFTGMTN